MPEVPVGAEAGLFKHLVGGLLRVPEDAGKDGAAAKASRIDALNQRVLAKGKESIGWYRWRGPSGPDPAKGWKVGTTNIRGNRDDFARWVRGWGGKAPGPTSNMNCWEAVMYTAYRGGAVSKKTLQEVHTEAANAADAAFKATNDKAPAYKAYYDRIAEFFAPGKQTVYEIDPKTGVGGPDIPAGHVILFNGNELDHVMLSLGTRDAQGRMEVLSHWVFPERTPSGPFTDQTYGVMQKTSVEEVLSTWGKDAKVVSAVPSWLK